MRVENPTRADFEEYEDKDIDVHLVLTSGTQYLRARISAVDNRGIQFWKDSASPGYLKDAWDEALSASYSRIAWMEPKGELEPIIVEPDPDVPDAMIDIVQSYDELGDSEAIVSVKRISDMMVRAYYLGGHAIEWQCASPAVADKIERMDRDHRRIRRQRNAKQATVEHRQYAEELRQQ